MFKCGSHSLIRAILIFSINLPIVILHHLKVRSMGCMSYGAASRGTWTLPSLLVDHCCRQQVVELLEVSRHSHRFPPWRVPPIEGGQEGDPPRS
eukprot:7438253-Heterocapsa_arctica.AAC.1